VVSELELATGERLEFLGRHSQESEVIRRYNYSSRHGVHEVGVEINGLGLKIHTNLEVAGKWHLSMGLNKLRCLWLRAGRKVPKITERTKRLRPIMNVDGSGALELLDHVPDVLEFVQRHFGRMTTPAGEAHGYALELERVLPDEMFLRLNATLVSAKRRVNAAQLGDGVQGAIPVLTALGWWATAHDEAPDLLAVEEPESQLHPSSQRALGEAVCDALRLIKERKRKLSRKLLVETHSDVLLMTVQLAIARGELDPKDVAIYWVKQDMETGVSAARLLDVHENGTLGGLPRAAFREKIDLSGELLNAIPAFRATPREEAPRTGRKGQRR
jgi:hypothetical protein